MVKISLNVEEQKREKIEIISEVYQLPKLEGVTKKTIITGRNRVNLYYLNCSCKTYRQNAKMYPRRDIRRICKHIYAKLFAEAESSLDSLTRMLLHNQFWFGQSAVKKVKFHNEIIYIGIHKLLKFVSVIQSFEDKCNKHIYDLPKDEWANGEKPFEEDKLNDDCQVLIKNIAEMNGR